MIQLQTLIDPQPIDAPVVPSPWYVVLTAPQQDLNTVSRLHRFGLELFVPIIRRRVPTGRIGKHGHKITRILARPMFEGYGFLRVTGIEGNDFKKIEDVRGVRGFYKDAEGKRYVLPDSAIQAVFRKQMEEQTSWLQSAGRHRRALWNRGDSVRIDAEGGVYAGLVAIVDRVDSKGRIQVLLGMIRHTLPADMVVAA